MRRRQIRKVLVGFAVVEVAYLLISSNGFRGFQPTECVHWHTGLVGIPGDNAEGGRDYDVGEVCDQRVKTGKKLLVRAVRG